MIIKDSRSVYLKDKPSEGELFNYEKNGITSYYKASIITEVINGDCQWLASECNLTEVHVLLLPILGYLNKYQIRYDYIYNSYLSNDHNILKLLIRKEEIEIIDYLINNEMYSYVEMSICNRFCILCFDISRNKYMEQVDYIMNGDYIFLDKLFISRIISFYGYKPIEPIYMQLINSPEYRIKLGIELSTEWKDTWTNSIKKHIVEIPENISLRTKLRNKELEINYL